MLDLFIKQVTNAGIFAVLLSFGIGAIVIVALIIGSKNNNHNGNKN